MMAAADDKLIEDSALEFSRRLHKELPLRHFGEFHDQEQLTEIVKVQKNNVFKMVFDKIWPREKEEIASLFKNLNRRMDKVIAEWKKKNRENEVRSVSLLQKWVDMLCENFNEALEHQVLLNPDMAVDTFKKYISSKKLTVTNVFESIWKPGTSRMLEERKLKLEKHLKMKEEEMLEKQKHNLESQSADQGKKLLGEVGAVLLERSRQLKSYVNKHQGRASNTVLKGMVQEILEYLVTGKGKMVKENHKEIYGKLLETLEDEVKFLNGDLEEKMKAEEVVGYAKRFNEKLRSYCIGTEEGSEAAQEIQEQDTQRRMTLQEILNECMEERSSEPNVGTQGEAHYNHDKGEIHADDDKVIVMHMENDARTSTAVEKRISRSRQSAKGDESSLNEVPLSMAEKTAGIHHRRESAKLKKNRKPVQAASSEGSRRQKILPDIISSSRSKANHGKDRLRSISDEGGMQIQVPLKSASEEQSRKRKQDKRSDNDEMEDSPPKQKKSRKDISKTRKIAGGQCPIRRSARARNASKQACAAILSSRITREPVVMKINKKMTNDDFQTEDGKNNGDDEELQLSAQAPVQPSSSKPGGKVWKGRQMGEQACPNQITLLQGDQPKYQCNVCKRKVRMKDSYMLKYHGDFCNDKNLPHICTECGKGFVQRKRLTVHSRSHRDEKPFKCPECPKGFKHRENMRRHIRIHTGEKPFKCTQCPMQFSQMGHLKRHICAHDRGTSFICKECNVNFVSSQAFYKHNLAHKEKLPIVCIYCKKRFAKMDVLKNHVIVHSGERPFQCPTCAISRTTKVTLRRHLETAHGCPAKVAIKFANEAALDYLLRETNSQSCRDIPQATINSAVVDYVIKKANLELPDRSNAASAESTNKNECE